MKRLAFVLLTLTIALSGVSAVPGSAAAFVIATCSPAGAAPAVITVSSCTSSVDVPNAALTGFTGPYAIMTVTLTSSTTATISYASQTNGGFTYLMGSTSAADINVNATSFTIGGLTALNSIPGFTVGTLSDGGSGVVSTFGSFNQTTNMSDGFTSAADFISFTLTNTGGTWASASDVLALNGDGFDAAVHAFACALPCSTTEGATVTGFAAEGPGGGGPPTSVPEPGILLLLGSGLAGLWQWSRRRA